MRYYIVKNWKDNTYYSGHGGIKFSKDINQADIYCEHEMDSIQLAEGEVWCQIGLVEKEVLHKVLYTVRNTTSGKYWHPLSVWAETTDLQEAQRFGDKDHSMIRGRAKDDEIVKLIKVDGKWVEEKE